MVMQKIPSESIDLVMYSPPYYGLRDYGKYSETIWGGNRICDHEWDKNNFCINCSAWKGQLGLEPSWRLYIQHLVEINREIKRILKRSGSMYIVIGDTYAGSMQGYGARKKSDTGIQFVGDGYYASSVMKPPQMKAEPYRSKCLMMIPYHLAFALIEDGWILRNDIIWLKLTPIPSSVKDRLTQTYEHVFHFVKSRKYYYNLDVIREPCKLRANPSLNPHVRKYLSTDDGESLKELKNVTKSNAQSRIDTKKLFPDEENSGDMIIRRGVLLTPEDSKLVLELERLGAYYRIHKKEGKGQIRKREVNEKGYSIHYWGLKGKNPGDIVNTNIWTVPSKPYKGAHFAVYPTTLCVRPILSSCPPDGVVLDPFIGSGTTALTCELINRRMWRLLSYEPNSTAKSIDWRLKWIGIDINPEYVRLARERIGEYTAQTRLSNF